MTIVPPPVSNVLPSHCVSRHFLRVRFGETDLMGIVHHGTYLSYFEVGRVEYMRERGLDYHSWTKLGFHLPVIEVGVRYRKSVRFDELICIETRLTELTRVKVRFDYNILRCFPDGREEVVALGHTLLACVGNDHVPRRLPADAEAIFRSAALQTSPRPALDFAARSAPEPAASHASAANGAAT